MASRAAKAGACVVDPTPALFSRRVRRRPLPPSRLALVYTGRSIPETLALVSRSAADGIDVRLWALGDTHPDLARWTVGSGPGSRLDLLSQLLGEPDDRWLVIADDDIVFRQGSISDLVRAADMLGFDIAQPSHERGSYTTHRITRRVPFTVARHTTFVETGPLVAFSPRVAPSVVPFAPLGMGWGIELLWQDMLHDGFQLGIIDAISLRHLFPAGIDYDRQDEFRQLRQMLDDRGYRTLADAQRTTASLGIRRLWSHRET
jgi:hypothetical protein